MGGKRLFVSGVVLALAAGALAGCKGEEKAPAENGGSKAGNEAAKDEGAEVKEPSYSAENPAHITYKSLAWILAEQDETKKVIDEWNEAHPEIQVEYVQGDWGTVDQEMLTSFETGDVPDIFQYWTAPIQLWKERGFLADLSPMLDEEMKKDVNQEVWDLMTSTDGKLTALPYQSEVDMIYYNKDMFEEKGIEAPAADDPWTLDELIDAARVLNDEDKGVKGIAIQGLNWAARFFNDSWATKAEVSPLITEGDTYKLNLDEEYRELMEKFIGMTEEGIMDPAIFTDGYDAKSAFMDGQIGILAGLGCYVRSEFIYEMGDKEVNWGMMAPVKIKTTASYGAIQTLSIPEKSENKEAAMEFLKYFWSTDCQERIAQSAYIFPGRNSAMERFNKKEEGWDLAYQSASNLVVPNYVSVPGWGSFMEGTGKTIYQEYFTGQITFDGFKEKMENQLLPFLEDARKK